MAEIYSDTTAMAHQVVKSSSWTSSSFIDDDYNEEDGCSICLEPFVLDEPPSVLTLIKLVRTNYHYPIRNFGSVSPSDHQMSTRVSHSIQAIQFRSQRSQECPVCWRPLVLQDPSEYAFPIQLIHYLVADQCSQELLVESIPARTSKPSSPSAITSNNEQVNLLRTNKMQYKSHYDEQRPIRNLHVSSRVPQLERIVNTETPVSNTTHLRTSATTQSQAAESPLFDIARPRYPPNPSRNSEKKQNLGTHRSGLSESTRRPSSSGTRSLSASLISKLSKSAQGIKEKFLTKNREITRMIERLDIKSKQPVSTPTGTPVSVCSKKDRAAVRLGRK